MAIAMLACAAQARAHGEDALVRASLADGLHLLIAVAACGYLYGLTKLWRAAGRGRGVTPAAAASFVAGLSILAIVVAEPIERYTADSFAAHMGQHEILMLIAAPLIVVGRPLACWTWALPFAARVPVARPFRTLAWRCLWHAVTSPSGAATLQLVLLLGWHVPGAFDAAATDAWVHAAQHASFLIGALAFWWSLVGTASRERVGGRIAALFLTMLATGALGALLTFAPRPWYAAYGGRAGALADQQLGGLLMWIPGGTVYLLAAIWLLRGWLERTPRIALR